MLVEDMSRNKCIFQVRISHVLRFISICGLFTDSPSHIPFHLYYTYSFSVPNALGYHCPTFLLSLATQNTIRKLYTYLEIQFYFSI
jgi:hypothetical protein